MHSLNSCILSLAFGLASMGWTTPTVVGAEADPALLRGRIRDAESGEAMPATVRIEDAAGRTIQQRESFPHGFRSNGTWEVSLPPGPTRIQVSRGFEYQPAESEITLHPGESRDLDFILHRIVDLREHGWYAGDSHVHMIHGERIVPVTFDYVALAARAEDLAYLSLSHAWTLSDPSPEALNAILKPLSHPDCRLRWNLEAPKNYYRGDAGRCLGHCWNLSMKGRTPSGENVIDLLLAASAGDYQSSRPSYANFESHRLIHQQGGAVFYTHPMRWWTGSWGGQGGYPRQEAMRISNMAVELPLDTVIGPTYDGLDVITGAREFSANAKAFQLWTLLLNHGYRPAATGSSDSCFDRVGGAIPGVPRTYTYLPDGFSWPRLAKATAAGHTFVTTGPLVLAALDHHPPGSEFPADGTSRDLHLEAWVADANSDHKGLTRIEVLRNGTSFREFKFSPPRSQWQSHLPLQETNQAWYCVSAFGSPEREQQAVTGAFFFTSKDTTPPAPTPATIHARILDALTNQPLPGTLTEISFIGPVPEIHQTHPTRAGTATLQIDATRRLTASAPGYRPLTLSPFLDFRPLRQTVTEFDDEDLLNWQTFEKIRQLLNEITLTFRLEPETP